VLPRVATAGPGSNPLDLRMRTVLPMTSDRRLGGRFGGLRVREGMMWSRPAVMAAVSCRSG
jgi:hypothetical protein